MEEIPRTHSQQSDSPTEGDSQENEILIEMQEFVRSFKGIDKMYKLVDKIGEGTFSSVYKAIDLHHSKFDNDSWLISSSSSDDSDNEKKTEACEPNQKKQKRIHKARMVALKRLCVTSSPIRIANEISILNRLRGCPHIISLITAMRQEDQVVVVLPYFRHDDFRYFFRDASMWLIRSYMRQLFIALTHLHKLNLIHRDVKPTNFLFNIQKNRGVLVDFGLTEPEEPASKNTAKAQLRRTRSKTMEGNNKENLPVETFVNSTAAAIKSAPRPAPHLLADEKRPGYPKNDKRKSVHANRAGTRGFRAPEVLFKVIHQTRAIDIWSAGVILLSFLTGRFPVFKSDDDVEALLEIAVIFGIKEMKACAATLNRTFLTNIPNIRENRVPFAKFCRVMYPEGFAEREKEDPHLLKMALDFLDRCMNLDPKGRITAEEALLHPFLREES
ncbi:uncharacterized protein VTP21DRAFT_9487 [Calcarisporiella thermophila]|uniref:uncharacterized protein n=1 Tax=Calcarisporiella thermophila TaxID=911321 RepID=UPI0037448EFB